MLDAFIKQILAPDIAIALVLMLVSAGVFFAVRIGVLPKKGAPFVAVALLAAIGFSMYRQKHAKNLHKVLKEKEKELKKREERLKELKTQFELSDKEATAAVAKRDAEIQAIAEEIIEVRAKHQEEVTEFQKMTPQERREHVLNLQFN
jgi:Skp family chaperone for outer membrane proteins